MGGRLVEIRVAKYELKGPYPPPQETISHEWTSDALSILLETCCPKDPAQARRTFFAKASRGTELSRLNFLTARGLALPRLVGR